VLILDEPTIRLDPRQIAGSRADRSLAGQHTVILSTHILPEVSMVCDGVIIINRGCIVAQGTESELVQQAFPSARIELRVAAGAGGDVAGAVAAIPGVVGVQPRPARDGSVGLLVEAARDRDVRPDLVRLVTGRGWALQELHQVGMSLEEVFIRAVAGEQEPQEPVPAAEETR
jgi:ABC-2 type transport system ATP-binding protein